MRKDFLIFFSGLLFLIGSTMFVFWFNHDITQKQYEVNALLLECQKAQLEYNKMRANYEYYMKKIVENHLAQMRTPDSTAQYYFVLVTPEEQGTQQGFRRVAQRIALVSR